VVNYAISITGQRGLWGAQEENEQQPQPTLT